MHISNFSVNTFGNGVLLRRIHYKIFIIYVCYYPKKLTSVKKTVTQSPNAWMLHVHFLACMVWPSLSWGNLQGDSCLCASCACGAGQHTKCDFNVISIYPTLSFKPSDETVTTPIIGLIEMSLRQY
jgi:hypothetical protein